MSLSIACVLVGISLVIPNEEAPSSSPVRSFPSPMAQGRTAPTESLPLIACVDSDETSFGWAGHALSESVSNATAGQLKLSYSGNGLIEGEKVYELDILRDVQAGRIAMAMVTASPLSNVEPDYEVFDLPFLFNSSAGMDRAVLGLPGRELLKGLSKSGLTGLASFDLGPRIFSSSTPMPNLASFKGKRVRVLETTTGIAMARFLGCEPVPAPVEKIDPMAKRGYIDAADRVYSSYWDFKGYENQRYITETYHTHGVKVLIANQRWFESLPQAQRDAIVRSIPAIEQGQRERQRRQDDSAKQRCIAMGIKIFLLTPKEREQFRRACQPLYAQYEKLRGDRVLRALKAAAAKPSPTG